MPCKHEDTKNLRTWCFTGPVYTPHITDENPAAHGNVIYEVECRDCGARRREAVNQCHVEVSAWESREHRVAEKRRRAREQVREASREWSANGATIRVHSPDGGSVAVTIDGSTRRYTPDQMHPARLEPGLPEAVVDTWVEIGRRAQILLEAAER